MGLLKRKNKLSLQLALGQLDEAIGRAEAGQPAYRHVRTAQGRTAHLQQAPPRVLCDWPGPWIPVPPGTELPECRTCRAVADGTAAAS